MTTPNQPHPYPQPHPPQPAKPGLSTGAIIGIAVGAVVIVCCGALTVAGMFGGDKDPATQPTRPATTAAAPTGLATAAADISPTAPTTPTEPTTSPSPSPTPKLVEMPNLVGVNAAVAEDKLRGLGFTKIEFGSVEEGDSLVIIRANWEVVKQSTKAGTKVSVDDLIVLSCKKLN